MKTLLLTFSTLLLFHTTFSQMVPVTTNIRTPYGNASVTQYKSSPSFFSGTDISVKYVFTVIMKNDSTFDSKTKIEYDSDKHSVTVRDAGNKKRIIYPSDTKGLTRIDESGQELYGVPADSCWLFQSASGRINCFSFLAEQGMDHVIAIQDGDEGPVVPLSKDNLRAIVGNDPKLLKLIEKGRMMRAVKLFNEREEDE